MLGDLGARVIKVEAPGSGDDTRGWGPPFVGEPDARQSTYFLCTNRNKESIALDLKDEADKDVLLGAGRARRRAGGELPHRRARAARPRHRGADAPQPAPRRPLDHRLRPRRPRGRPRRLRPDRPGRGRPDVADRVRPRRPAARRRTRSPTCCPGCTARTACSPRSTSASATGKGTVVRTSLLASVVGVHAFQGTRWTVAGEVGRAQGNHHPSIAPYGLFHCRDGAVQIALGSEGLWKRFCEGFGLDPDAEGLATNAERVGRARAGHRGRRAGLRRLGRRAAAGPARRGRRSRPARCAPSTRSTRGTRSPARACWSTSSTRPWAASRCPARRCGSSTPTAPRSPARDHVAPPLLDQHADEIRAWVGGGGA